MSLEEVVSDWEIDEIMSELESGDAPDVVAFRHGVPLEDVRAYRSSVKLISRPRWTEYEVTFLRDNYPMHDRRWHGWKFLRRTWDSIRKMASRLGIRQKGVMR